MQQWAPESTSHQRFQVPRRSAHSTHQSEPPFHKLPLLPQGSLVPPVPAPPVSLRKLWLCDNSAVLMQGYVLMTCLTSQSLSPLERTQEARLPCSPPTPTRDTAFYINQTELMDWLMKDQVRDFKVALLMPANDNTKNVIPSDS